MYRIMFLQHTFPKLHYRIFTPVLNNPKVQNKSFLGIKKPAKFTMTTTTTTIAKKKNNSSSSSSSSKESNITTKNKIRFFLRHDYRFIH